MDFKCGDKITIDKNKSSYKGDFSIREIIEVNEAAEEYRVKTNTGIFRIDFFNQNLYRIATPKEIKKDQLKNLFTTSIQV